MITAAWQAARDVGREGKVISRASRVAACFGLK
jgi:hypothetical protein